MEMEMQLNIFVYWDRGYDQMPPMLQTIYKHNKLICEKFDIHLILVDDNNVYDFIEPHEKFKTLKANFKSDIIRYYILNKFGGFWFDTDVIIIKNLKVLYKSFLQQDVQAILDVEYGNNIGCASLCMKPNSICSNFCVNYVKQYLDANKPLKWGEIGPRTAENLWKNHRDQIILNDYNRVKKGCNFICWNERPGFNKTTWFCSNAKMKAKKLIENPECYYVITWTIYKWNNIKENLTDFVFRDNRSVFSHLINDHIVKKSLPDKKINFFKIRQYNWNDTCWSVVLDAISKCHNDSGVVIDCTLEDSFYYGTPRITTEDEWIGISHQPPLILSEMLKKKEIYKYMDKCRGIFCLSQHCKKYLENIFTNVVVENLYHPCPIRTHLFNYKKFIKKKQIRFLGKHLRKYDIFDKLSVSYGKLQGRKFVYINLKDFNISFIDTIMFIDVQDASAMNGVIECMQRNTPLLVCKHPAIIEYLGEKYPFYFESLEEANRKANDISLIYETHLYLKNMNKKKIQVDTFYNDFVHSKIYRNL